MNRVLTSFLLAALVVGVSACPDNEYDYKTWTKKLDDSKESDRAVEKIVQLGNPGAIPALGEAWKSQGKPTKFLQAMISLSRPLTPQQADQENLTDYAKTGRPASWDKALPYLKEALDEVDDDNHLSVESAEKAADALALARLDDGLDSLITFANKPIKKKTINAQIRAIRAIGKYEQQKQKAGEALIKIIEQPVEKNPRSVPDDQQKLAQENFTFYLGKTGQAINSLAELRYPNATKTLVKQVFRTPELFTQLRRALVASGPSAEEELKKVLRDEQPDVKELFMANHLDRYCGDKNNLPSDQCQPVSAHDFYPAVVLGDFYNPKDVPDLLAALKRDALPVYYMDDQPSPNSQYNAIFDALRKIGSNEGADQIHDMWAGKKAAPAPRGRRGAAAPEPADNGADIETRKLAINAYPFLVRGDTGAAELGAIAADNNADQFLRTEAATAFARLAHSKGDIAILQGLAQKYFDASDKKLKESQGKPKQDAEAADKELEKVKKKFEEVKQASIKIVNTTKDPAVITKAADDAKNAEDEYKAAKKKHATAVAPFKQLERAVKDYKNYARMFQMHIARIEVAIRCKDNLDCYVDTLKLALPDIKKGAEIAAKNCSEYIKDIKDWTVDEKVGLVEGEVERAMLEIGKRGKKASQYTDALLEAAKSDDRLVRQSILLALPKIANVPCKECEKKLEAAVKAGEGKSTLGDLTLETTMLRNYFAWAGGNTPSSSFADEAPTTPTK